MNIKKIIVLLIFAVAIIGIIAPVSAAISSENKVYSIESKEKAVKYKVTERKWWENRFKKDNSVLC